MSANRRFKRAQERFKDKIHKEFIQKTKSMTEEQVRNYVNKKVEKYAYLDQVAVINEGFELKSVELDNPFNGFNTEQLDINGD